MKGAAFWLGMLGFFTGVAAGDLGAFDWTFSLALAVCALGPLVSRDRRGVLFALFLGAAALGVLRVDMERYFARSNLEDFVGKKVILTGSIADEPDKRDTNVRLIVNPERVSTKNGTDSAVSGAVRVLGSARLPAAFTYGETVHMSGTLERPEPFETTPGRSFDYPGYLAARGVYYQIAYPIFEVVAPAPWSVHRTLFSVKQSYLDSLHRTLPEPYASLAGGITVGDKRSIGEKLSEEFRRVGLVHIVVLSGFNITIVVSVLMLLVRDASLIVRFCFGAVIIVAFVLMTGASATGIRAAVMAILALLAAASYRTYAIDHALVFASLGMVLWNPHVLLHDPSFQLSVLATVGLVHVSPPIAARLRGVTERFSLREIIAATLGTQLVVLPLLLYQTGLISFVALPANLAVLPVIPAAMLFSAIASAAGMLSATLGMIAAVPAYGLLWYAVAMTRFFASVPFGAIEIPPFSAGFVLAAYGVFALFFFMQKKKAGESPAGH